MSAALAEQQQALLQALLDWPPQSATENVANYVIDIRGRGLKTYQANAHALAQRALTAAYPVVAQMVGDESFAALARALWHRHPPTAGDAARWGDALADFLANDPQLADHPYLADVARCEWALHRAEFAADTTPELATVALLAQEDPALLTVALAPGTCCVASRWPVAALLAAHQHPGASLDHAAQLLRDGAGQTVVVWRQGLQSQWREALAGEVVLLQALARGDSFLAASEAAAPDLDLAQWLPLAVHSGLLVRVSLFDGGTA